MHYTFQVIAAGTRKRTDYSFQAPENVCDAIVAQTLYQSLHSKDYFYFGWLHTL